MLQISSKPSLVLGGIISIAALGGFEAALVRVRWNGSHQYWGHPGGRHHRHITSMRTATAPLPTSSGECSDDQDSLDRRVARVVSAMPSPPSCAVVGGGFSGLSTAYHLASFGARVTLFDPEEVGKGGASSVAAGMLHPLTPKGKVIWKGEEGYAAAIRLIEVAEAALRSEAGASPGDTTSRCVSSRSVFRPLLDESHQEMYLRAAEETPQWVKVFSPEEFLEMVPGVDRGCIGGVCIKGALAVDSQAYLRGLWLACQALGNKMERGGRGCEPTEGRAGEEQG
ncbi:unnamed protein product, partial [Discosporangium mesarthrocarpum]